MSPLVQTVLADLDHEFANTRTMLSRIPDSQLDFSPHPKSWPLGKLATHLLDFPFWGQTTIETTSLDFAAPAPAKHIPATTAEFLSTWDARVVAFKDVLAKVTDADLQIDWVGMAGSHEVLRMPRIAVLRSMVVNHMIHHRAQLSIYFRMLDVPLPGMYGPTADEK
ncbi:MAG: DinB family protein [Gemmatimonadaceae bacterium]|nr:DinB family protein [Gemmatimonadaceae bacterium]